uniref:glycosyltransferase n=1 Tax=Prochlorothrix hollandica TaxID=1223 RepID=UPI00333E82C9
RDQPHILSQCLNSIFNKTTYSNYEIILVDNGSTQPDTQQLIQHWQQTKPNQFHSIRLDIPFNFSHINNQATQIATGDYLLFLNNDTEIITPDWIEALLEQAQRPSIGAVGATLLYPDNTLQHSGIILGSGILAGNSHIPYQYIHNSAAVTAACLMCRRETFLEVGGFEENLPVAFNDVDLCLKFLQNGYYNVCLPHVNLYHHESKTLGSKQSLEEIHQYDREIRYMVDRWASYLQADPCVSPHHIWRNPPFTYDLSLTVIVPWWDHPEFLPLWETNLKHLPNCQIIFIDNGSQPPAAAQLQTFCTQHQITLIRNAENRGFAAANNQGLAIAQGTYILHLNNDLQILEPLPLAYLCAAAGEGLTGPALSANELNIPYVEGWALCIRRSTLEDLGGWGEDYGPGYWDDVDLNHRATLAGYPIRPLPLLNQLIRHKTNATGRDGRLDQLALHARNRGIFIRKFFSITPKILIDGVFFQLYQTGIARVWRSLLHQWANTELGQHIVILDRGQTAPQIPGLRYRTIPPFSYQNLEGDRQLLQQICDEENADLLISTYYTTPLTTPTVFMGYDMIPEVMQSLGAPVDLRDPMWVAKHHAINHASHYLTISENTAQDLQQFFPDIAPAQITVAPCGVSPTFTPPTAAEIAQFKHKYGITKPYFMTIGSGAGGYKT